MEQSLSGETFLRLVRAGAENLNRSRQAINELNVFPVPDGDTGDNMYMTIASGVSGVTETASLGDVSGQIARKMLFGAHGNSGVILSRIFAGIARGFEGKTQADLPAVAAALACGVEESYGAVPEPVEGTILTVWRDAVQFANSRANGTLETYFDDLLCELRRSLARTPDLLAALREANVVDSGGAGLLCIAEGMKNGSDDLLPAFSDEPKNAPDLSLFTEDSVLVYGYCTEFLLRLQKSKTDLNAFDLAAFIRRLEECGNSIVAFRDGSIVKVHIHTFDPGRVLSLCRDYGEFLTVKVENMSLQHNGATVPQKKAPHKPFAFVVTASGQGIRDTFLSLGADKVVEGGQTQNPSAEDFIRAFDALDADTIFVFPNNKNVILTAKQAASLYDRAKIAVVESRTVGEGYAALSMLDTSSNDTDAILRELTDAMHGVETGMISRATRDTEKDGVAVRKGDFIGFTEDRIFCDREDRAEAVLSLAGALHAEKRDVLLLFYGEETPEEEARALAKRLASTLPRTEVILLEGKQPVYDYLLILE